MILSGIDSLSGIGIIVSWSLMFRDSFSIFGSIHIVPFRSILQIHVEDSMSRISTKNRNFVNNLELYRCFSKYCLFTHTLLYIYVLQCLITDINATCL